MNDGALHCLDEGRRDDVRAASLYGLDDVEVSDNQLILHVCFLGKAPPVIKEANVRIRGGRRVRDIRVTSVVVHRRAATLDDLMDVTVKTPGDFSTYTLSMVELDTAGHPTGEPMKGFDRRYATVEFSFKAGCPSDLDCKSEPICPPPARVEPEISYLAKDYASFRQLILDRLALIMPGWRETHVPDLGIAVVEVLAYVGDYLSYYQDAVATEAYLGTARRRISVRRHARLVDYAMHEGANARAWVTISTDTDILLDLDQLAVITGYPGAPENRHVLAAADLANVPAGRYDVFEPLWPGRDQKTMQLYRTHSEIHFYTWGDGECCLGPGATSATLVDSGLKLQEGDVLLFEEVIGPGTGNPADADPTHRQAVRLTRVTPAVDTLYTPHRPLFDIEWSAEDALTFPLCISAPGLPPECIAMTNVSVVWGNVILVDHGQTIGETLGTVPAESTHARCPTDCEPAEVEIVPGRFRPVLGRRPLTFSEPLAPGASATALVRQDPRKALPWIGVSSSPPALAWDPRRDLLASGPDDRDFVVEVDDDGHGHPRFGDGDLGRMPDAGSSFQATYRVGNGRAGNVGAEAIAYVLLGKTALSGAHIVPRNPLPAVGGTEPEPLAEVKLFAPRAFRKELLRAITSDDYAALAEKNDGVQRAAARLCWTGSWYEALVAIDPLGTEETDREGLDAIAAGLEPYRRIGQDLVVKPARYVGLDVALRICVRPHYLRGHVEAALRDVLGGTGFFHPDNLSFGEGIYASALVAAAQAVTGVQSVDVIRLERCFEGPNDEARNGVLRLGPLEIARLDNDPSFPENGRLVLDMEGGR